MSALLGHFAPSMMTALAITQSIHQTSVSQNAFAVATSHFRYMHGHGRQGNSANDLMASVSSYEELRKEERKVEGQLYTKLTQYCKYTTKRFASPANKAEEEEIRRDQAAIQELEDEIEQLLNKLSQLNEQMRVSVGASDAQSMAFTLQRSRAILHDYTQDFRRSKSKIQAALDRALLLCNVDRSDDGTLRPRTEMMCREKQSLHSSVRMADDLINQALETKKSLAHQRELFGGMGNKLTNLGDAFPAIRDTLSKIQFHRRKDMIVMGSVIAFCICFTLLYILRR